MTTAGERRGNSGSGAAPAKADTAFRTIGEVTQLTGVAAHILRYWEGRFPQLRPITRAGNRRYYRPGDVALVQRIDRLLNHEGYTVRGVQQLLSGERTPTASAPTSTSAGAPPPAAPIATVLPDTLDAIRLIRDYLRESLDADG
ncbi:MerR family transcriptional regulator [Sphingomonas sp. RHCKR47]|uniref:MerR family transcriptional regulator n=1 Tax=Sphingomonas citricola TaxID=2862498 RepID=UPI001C66DDA3|nr:MerR family transcriptional regulator [Sphingomonas citricola]MBW6524327.1 MerR family transcriptional regulator [Sphingomonas citricola]